MKVYDVLVRVKGSQNAIDKVLGELEELKKRLKGLLEVEKGTVTFYGTTVEEEKVLKDGSLLD